MSAAQPPDTVRDPSSNAARLQQCLPVELQLATTTITPIAAGMSGAGVYRVVAGNQQFVLKITPADEPIAAWRTKVLVQQTAADAGIAPQLIHADEDRRAVLSELIVDQSFPAQLGNPATRAAAIVALGQMLRRLHALPIPADLAPANAIGFLDSICNSLPSDFVLPTFVRSAIANLRATPAMHSEAIVLSHNDVNPTNLVFDGTRVMLLDWQTCAPHDPYYDLAAIAMFFRFDDATSRALVSAHDGAPVAELPAAFNYHRKFAAVLSGIASMHLARLRGHPGGEVAANATLSLGELYQQLRSGAFDIGSVNGQWTFGMALVKEGAATT